ncbi:MAG TPA: flagellar brake protein [Dissulfurispiraceae bacterium]|nr:flagellar brake protein [Dissulfurispiraceae bacterium]
MSSELFNPGLPLLLQLPKLEQRVGIYVLGWQKELFLLTNLPYLNDKPVKLKKEDNCIIRFLKGDDAYGFQTSIISVQFFPAPLIFFKYPQEINRTPFRKSKRFNLNILAKLMNPQNVMKFDVELCDVSETGCRVKLSGIEEEAFPVGTSFYLTFNILEKGIEADCILRNVRKMEDSLYLGMEFTEISQGNKETITAFIEMLSKVVTSA